MPPSFSRSPATQAPSAPRWRRPAVALAAIAVVLILSVVIVRQVRQARVRAATEAELDRIARAGEPTDGRAIAPEPPPPDANAAIPIREAIARYDEGPWDPALHEARRTLLEDPWGAGEAEARRVRTWVHENDEVAQPLAESLRRDESYWPGDWEPLAETLFSSSGGPTPAAADRFGAASDLRDWRLARAILAARGGDAAAAFGEVMAALDLAEKCGGSPLPLPMLARRSLEDDTLTVLAALMERTAPPPEARERLRRRLDATELATLLPVMLVNERARVLDLYRHLESDGGGLRELQGNESTLDLAWNRLRYLKLMARAIDIARSPPHHQPARWEALDEETQDARDDAVLAGLMMYPPVYAARRCLGHVARRRLAAAALALEGQRLADGSLPAQALQTIHHLDPLTGRPLGWRRTPSGDVLLWAHDLEDGKVVVPDADDAAFPELVWRVPAQR